MHQRILFLTGCLCIALCIQACKSTSKSIASSETNTPHLNILLQDSGKTFKLKVHEKFDVTYNECIGCADKWKITSIDSTKIGLLSITYSNRSCIDCLGGNQDKTFHFDAKKKGISMISFGYFKYSIRVYIVSTR
jgi:hypothetical protein